MVYKTSTWFIYEEGDRVNILPRGTEGVVTKVTSTHLQQKNQNLIIKTHKGVKEYHSNMVDLNQPIRTTYIR